MAACRTALAWLYHSGGHHGAELELSASGRQWDSGAGAPHCWAKAVWGIRDPRLRPRLCPHAMNTAWAIHGSCRGQQGQGLHNICMLQLCILCQPCVPERQHWAQGPLGATMPCGLPDMCPSGPAGKEHQQADLWDGGNSGYCGGPSSMVDRGQGHAHSFGSCRVGPAPHARASRSQPCSFAFQRSLAPAHPSARASPCWVSAPTSARPMPTALGSRSVAGMAVARSPV